jgi:hypothetical protein
MWAMSTAASVQRLRGHIVRRLPTDQELARRRPVILTRRDERLLAAIYTHGILTAELIELAFYPGQPDRRSPSSCCYERLRQLWLWGYVERIELPVARTLGGSRPYLYTLGPRAVPVVGAMLGAGAAPVQRRRRDRIDDVFVEHDLRIAAFWANLVALLRARRARLRRWVAERTLRARQLRVEDPRTRRWLPVLPDAGFEVAYPDGSVQTALPEVDMGTLTLARFRRKVRVFELCARQGLAALHGSGACEVLVLTHSRPRLEQLWRATRQEVAEERRSWHSFATLDILAPDVFTAADWVTASNELVPLLYDDAPAEAPPQPAP